MTNSNIKIKKYNRNKIFRYISRNRVVSNSDISKALKLSLPTVSQNIEALTQMDLIIEKGFCKSSGGRRPKMVACNPRAKVAIGIDITVDHIQEVVVDLLGNIIDHVWIVQPCLVNKEYLEQLKDSIDAMLSKNKIPSEKVYGVGISLPAIIDKDKKIYQTAFNTTLPANFLEVLQEYIPYPVDYFNDASSGGFAEFWGDKSIKSLFYLSLSKTIGGSIMLQNRIWDGDSFRSGEIGHTSLIPGGKKCYCGRNGCVNAYLSSDNLSEFSDGNLDRFFEMLEEEQPDIIREWNTYIELLAYVINNIYMLFDCHIIIGGYIGKYMSKYIDRLKTLVSEKDAFSRDASYISCCKYCSESSAVGAALMFIQDFIDKI